MARITTGYSRLQIALHWAIALLILFQYVGADTIEHYVKNAGIATAYASGDAPLMARAHVLMGLLVFVLMLVRVLLRLTKGAPALPDEESAVMKMVAHATHGLLYLLLFLMPASGAVAWFGASALADKAHLVMKVLLLVFVGLHILGALYHQFVLKNGLIRRMMKAG